VKKWIKNMSYKLKILLMFIALTGAICLYQGLTYLGLRLSGYSEVEAKQEMDRG
jgi:hypothetical protein